MRPTGWTIYIEHTLSVQHLLPTGVPSENRARADILCSKTKAFLLITVSEPSDVGLRHAQAAGKGVYGDRISSFSQPSTVSPSGMRVFLRVICFLVLPPLPSHNPMESVAAVYVVPSIQLSLRLRFTFLGEALFFMQNKVDMRPLDIIQPSEL